MDRTQGELLLLLADRLEASVADEHFDMGHWWCGTAGCAMGHAAQMPEFQRLGLCVEFPQIPNGHAMALLLRNDAGELVGGGMGAPSQLFGLSLTDTLRLFGVANYPSSRVEVLQRLRDYVYGRFPELEPPVIAVLDLPSPAEVLPLRNELPSIL